MTTIKIEMTEEEVREALADYIGRQEPWASIQNIDPLDVELKVGIDHHDRQPGMSGTASFTKAIITIKGELIDIR
ncbi:hypothetical protein LCGC14_2389370 [marine sediment metagenome]|uniref:Uncharacterized protein n=1 Tax=marine sediment metagenome TaxID=412755 RepID=A0A0F9BYK7_9ZZZZ